MLSCKFFEEFFGFVAAVYRSKNQDCEFDWRLLGSWVRSGCDILIVSILASGECLPLLSIPSSLTLSH